MRTDFSVSLGRTDGPAGCCMQVLEARTACDPGRFSPARLQRETRL